MTDAMRTTQPIPDTRIYRAMKAGHLARTGHELTGHLDTRQGYAVLVSSCCPDEPCTCRDCRPAPVQALPVPHIDCCGQRRRAPWCQRVTGTDR